MESKIDWSKAPEDATHYQAATHGVFECWLKRGHAVRVSRGEPDWREDDYADDLIATSAIKRPWSGEGLPPVGVKVLIMNPEKFAITDYGQEFVGEECTVRAVFVNDLDYRMVAVEKVGGACCCFISEMCFPIRTPEQIAADDRESAIDAMWSHYLQPILAPAQKSQVITALGLMYDAGFRKP